MQNIGRLDCLPFELVIKARRPLIVAAASSRSTCRPRRHVLGDKPHGRQRSSTRTEFCCLFCSCLHEREKEKESTIENGLRSQSNATRSSGSRSSQ